MSTTTDSRPSSKASAGQQTNNGSNTRPMSEASNRTESRGESRGGSRAESQASSRESYSRSRGDSRSSPRKTRANKIYRCPPTPDPDYFMEREKSFTLDNIAMSSVERENNLQNPKVGTVIPPYNAHYDRHPRAYFKFTGVDKLLKATDQVKGRGDTSTMGTLVDYHWEEGKGARYLQLRNFEFGGGKSWGERAGPGRFITPLRTSFYAGDPDAAFGRHFESPYSEPVSRASSRTDLRSREGGTRAATREGTTRSSRRTESAATTSRGSAYSGSASSNRGQSATEEKSSQSRSARYKSSGNKY